VVPDCQGRVESASKDISLIGFIPRLFYGSRTPVRTTSFHRFIFLDCLGIEAALGCSSESAGVLEKHRITAEPHHDTTTPPRHSYQTRAELPIPFQQCPARAPPPRRLTLRCHYRRTPLTSPPNRSCRPTRRRAPLTRTRCQNPNSGGTASEAL